MKIPGLALSCIASYVSLVTACGSSHPPRSAASAPAAPSGAAPASTPAEAAAPAPAGTKSLYQRLGGRPAITAVVDNFVGRTTTDPRIKERFFNTDPVHLKAMLVEQVCQATGGPCTYSGRDMKTTHGGMVLVDEEFTALVEDLTAALDTSHVPDHEKGELLGALAGMKPDIVAPPDQLHPIAPAKLAAATKLAGTLQNPEAVSLLTMAVTAGGRGQRNYAEQLFSRAELLVGPEAVASIAPVFRASAPPRVTTPLKAMAKDSAPQPKVAVGGSEDDEPRSKGGATLEGAILVDGLPLRGVGVVMLEPTTGKLKHRTPKTRVVEQRGREFAPHLVAVPVGSTIVFPNFDSIFHNVFSLSQAASFDLGLYRNGESREVTFKKEGIVRIGCNLHSSMSAFIIVVAAPHYAVADAAGVFHFRSLAPGKYTMKAWSEHSAAPLASELEVKPGENKISVPLAADASRRNPDKFGEDR
jgi:hemoglobin